MLVAIGLTAGWQRGAAAIRAIDLELAAGRVLAVVGRNGAGKTTLVSALAGLVPWRTGIVRLGEARIEGWRPERIAAAGLALVPQGGGVFPGLTVAENLALGAAGGRRPFPDRALWARFPALLERRDRPADTLSGGERRQLAIARALAMRPRLLLLDEPSEGIQPSLVERLGELLAELVQVDGLGLLLVEQDLDLVVRLADEVLVLQDGAIVDRLAGAELADRPERVERHLGL
ncbi:MAG: ATP-binding cassette domain-containing protein [Geminicoccaceae bacterium]|nr:ATP-binding cassette domain-containing protein [Geminicoccaceae bacterium]MDW8369970.1 ATP-binding cassette domain-containing protein [Geminicoccaceae bacterium]